MELIGINNKSEKKIEIILKIDGKLKSFDFGYSSNGVFAVNFPESLRKVLRPMPVSVTHGLVNLIENYVNFGLTKSSKEFETKQVEDSYQFV
jgi:hypothetical protein